MRLKELIAEEKHAPTVVCCVHAQVWQDKAVVFVLIVHVCIVDSCDQIF